jgi:hypothetical protein
MTSVLVRWRLRQDWKRFMSVRSPMMMMMIVDNDWWGRRERSITGLTHSWLSTQTKVSTKNNSARVFICILSLSFLLFENYWRILLAHF